MPMTPFTATVTKSPRGGFVHLHGDPGQKYPPAGQHVIVFNYNDFAGPLAAIEACQEDIERWAKVQAMLGPDVLEDIAAGRIVRQDPAEVSAPRPVIGWITPEDMRRVQAAPAEGHSRWVPIRTHRDDSYTVPLQASPPAAPRTVRVPWAKAVEQQLTAISADLRRPQEVAGAAMVDGRLELTDWAARAIVPVGADGMVEVLDDGPDGVVVPPTPNCARCRDSGEPCPYCWENPDGRPA